MRCWLVVLLISIAPATAGAQCTGRGAEIRDYSDLEVGVRGWIDVRWDGTDWAPARALSMPHHHASRIEWADAAAHAELTAQRSETLRVSFVVADRQLVSSRHRGVRVDATSRLDIEAICAVPPPT